MKKSIKSIVMIIVLFILLVFLVGCENRNQENTVVEEQSNSINNNLESKVAEEKINIEEGKYKIVEENQSEELPKEDIYLEINANELTLVDRYARITQIGTFEIRNNKLVGKYNEIEYFDQNTNSMLEKEISNELEFEILEDGTLKDNIGFGIIFGEPLYKGEVYKLEIE